MLKLGPPDRRKGAQKGERKGIEIKKNFVKLFWYEMSSYRPICFNYYCQLYTKLAYWLIDWLIERKGKGKKGLKRERKKREKREREKKRKIQESGGGNGK